MWLVYFLFISMKTKKKLQNSLRCNNLSNRHSNKKIYSQHIHLTHPHRIPISRLQCSSLFLFYFLSLSLSVLIRFLKCLSFRLFNGCSLLFHTTIIVTFYLIKLSRKCFLNINRFGLTLPENLLFFLTHRKWFFLSCIELERCYIYIWIIFHLFFMQIERTFFFLCFLHFFLLIPIFNTHPRKKNNWILKITNFFNSHRHLGWIYAEYIQQRTIPVVVEHAVDTIPSSIHCLVIGSTWFGQWSVAATRFRHGKTTNFCFFWWCESDTTSCIQWSCWRSF